MSNPAREGCKQARLKVIPLLMKPVVSVALIYIWCHRVIREAPVTAATGCAKRSAGSTAAGAQPRARHGDNLCLWMPAQRRQITQALKPSRTLSASLATRAHRLPPPFRLRTWNTDKRSSAASSSSRRLCDEFKPGHGRQKHRMKTHTTSRLTNSSLGMVGQNIG